jgi:CheY-like chemotaxis protein
MIEQVDILIVEDDADDLTLALRALQQEHLANRIFLARDGEQALDFLFCRGDYAGRSADSLPKLVLLDLMLPRVNGIEILQTDQGRHAHQGGSRGDPYFFERRTGFDRQL